MKKLICLLICLCTLFTFCCCSGNVAEYSKLNAAAEGTFTTEHLNNATYDAAYRDFSYRFFKTVTGSDAKNLCISPLSAYMAFSLCFYGSESLTAEEFKQTFGLSKAQAAEYCQSLYARFMQREYETESTKVNLANSVWIDNTIASAVKADYLTGATNYYDAQVFKCDFSNKGTVKAINDWCFDNTDGLIPQIIDKLDEDTILALINALLVEAAWTEEYFPAYIKDGVFHNANGSASSVKFLDRTISTCYLTSDAKAFKMPLRDDFSFVGILPNEDVSISNYCASLTAEKIASLFANKTSNYNVYTRIPKFSMDYDVNLIDTMMAMGLSRAFDSENADFKSLVEIPGKNVYINEAIQKTHFEVDEKGVKAAAVTMLEFYATAMPPQDRPFVYIYLDRPFVYMLVDDSTNLPLFIGRINSL